jgi:hypothetical protein
MDEKDTEGVDKFSYLDCVVTNIGVAEENVKIMVWKGNATFIQHCRVRSAREINVLTMLRIFGCNI